MLTDSFLISLYQIGAIQFGEYRLKTGAKTAVYVNLRKIISYPNMLREIAEAIWEAVAHVQFDLVCGVPYAALPIATCISLDHQIPMIMRRKEKKAYGTKQMIEGEYHAGQTCLIVEDVITAGTSIIETAEELEAVGLKVNQVVALVDREQGGFENLSKRYQAKTILSLPRMLRVLSESKLLSANELDHVQQYLAEKSK